MRRGIEEEVIERACFILSKLEIEMLTSVVVDVEFAGVPLTGHTPESFKLAATQGVQSLVPRRVLDKAGLVTEAVVAVLPHAVEVGLVLPVVTTREATVLVKPEPHVALGHRLVLAHPDGVLHAGLLVGGPA